MNSLSTPIQDQLTTWLLRKTAPSAARRVLPLSAAVATEIGNLRNENQDRAIIARGRDKDFREFIVAAVADGIGGMKDGDKCAASSLGAFIAHINEQVVSGANSSESILRAAIDSANRHVSSKWGGSGGTTMVAALLRPGEPTYWLSVGDSRIYGLGGSRLRQISTDDTIAGQLGKSENSDPDQSKLLQYIGMGRDLEPHIHRIDSLVESLILTTDGVHYLASPPKWFESIIHYSPDPGVCVKRLVEVARWCGGPDNATVAVITLSGNREFDSKPSHQCIEIWDSFGELQLITYALSGNYSAATDRVPPPAETPIQKNAAKLDVPAPAESNTALEQVHDLPAPDKAKRRRSKSADAKGGKRTKSKKESQLLITFPQKNN